jgi:hypothetical protein
MKRNLLLNELDLRYTLYSKMLCNYPRKRQIMEEYFDYREQILQTPDYDIFLQAMMTL